MNCEADIKGITDGNKNMLIPFYLILSFLYYKKDTSLVSDSFFDNMANEIMSKYNEIQHMHKELITLDMLMAGTYLGKYPSMVEGAAESFLKKVSEKGK